MRDALDDASLDQFLDAKQEDTLKSFKFCHRTTILNTIEKDAKLLLAYSHYADQLYSW